MFVSSVKKKRYKRKNTKHLKIYKLKKKHGQMDDDENAVGPGGGVVKKKVATGATGAGGAFPSEGGTANYETYHPHVNEAHSTGNKM